MQTFGFPGPGCPTVQTAPCGLGSERREPSLGAGRCCRFPGQVVWIKFIGTHGSYDRIDVKKL